VDTAQVVPASGKDHVLRAFDELEDHLRAETVFIVDCDGGIEDRYKGSRELVITTNRDIEADILFELNALPRLALDVLAGRANNPSSVQALADDALSQAATLATFIGLVHSAAIALTLPTKVIGANGRRQKFRLTDLAELHHRVQTNGLRDAEAVANAVAPLVGWDTDDVNAVSAKAAASAQQPCAEHGRRGCSQCLRRAYCNGHQLVDALGAVFATRHGVRMTRPELERAVRLAADPTRVPAWKVAERVRDWGVAVGIQILR